MIVSDESALPNDRLNFKTYHFNFKKKLDKTNQKIKVNKIESHAIEKNKRLDKFNQYVEELIYNYYQNQTKLDSDRIKFDLAL
jgi:hypothetical protein